MLFAYVIKKRTQPSWMRLGDIIVKESYRLNVTLICEAILRAHVHEVIVIN